MTIVAMWAMTDIEIKRLQVCDRSPYQKSPCLNRFSPTLTSLTRGPILNGVCSWITPARGKFSPFVVVHHYLTQPGSKSVAWVYAWQNGHTLIAITSVLVVMCIALQPLAAALLDVRDTFWDPQDCTFTMIYTSSHSLTNPGSAFIVNNLAKVGLNKNEQFSDLTGWPTSSLICSILTFRVGRFRHRCRICVLCHPL
jgi:hypothetical protein